MSEEPKEANRDPDQNTAGAICASNGSCECRVSLDAPYLPQTCKSLATAGKSRYGASILNNLNSSKLAVRESALSPNPTGLADDLSPKGRPLLPITGYVGRFALVPNLAVQIARGAEPMALNL